MWAPLMGGEVAPVGNHVLREETYLPLILLICSERNDILVPLQSNKVESRQTLTLVPDRTLWMCVGAWKSSWDYR